MRIRGRLDRIISSNLNLAMVAGGRDAVIGMFDGRAPGTPASIDDVLGARLGGTPMGSFVQATGGLQPTLVNNRIKFLGTQKVTGPRDARLALDSGAPFGILVIGKFNAATPGVYVANDTANGALYPWAGVQATGGMLKGDFAPSSGGTGRSQPQETGVPSGDGNVRMIYITKTSRYSLNPGTNEDWRFGIGGNQQQMYAAASVAGAVVGGCMPAMGAIFGTSADVEIAHVMFIKCELDDVLLKAWLAFGQSEHNAVLSNDQYGTNCTTGDSLVYGSHGTGVLSTVVGSGTTTPFWVASRTAGTRGTWLARGLAVKEAHSGIRGISGRNMQSTLDRWSVDISPLIDGCRAGKRVLWMRNCGNGVQGLSWSLTDLQRRTIEINRRRIAEGWDELFLELEIDRTSGLNGNGVARGWYQNVSPDTTLGPAGQVASDWNTWVTAQAANYGWRIINPNTNALFTLGTRAMDNAGTSDDGTHLLDAAQAAKGVIAKTAIDLVNPWP